MKKFLVALSITIAVIVLFISALYIVVYNKAQKEPDNNPSYYLEEVKPGSENKVLVCIGDSITHGRVSENYVDILSEKLADRGIDVVNAGINSELAYNVLQRIDEVIMCDPDYITILIGTNDANGSLSEKKGKQYMEEMALPQMPTKEWYEENLTAVCDVLKAETDAKIALLSLPPIGEDIDSLAYDRTTEYSGIIKDTAKRERLTYLPLHEEMAEFLIASAHEPGISFDKDDPTYIMYKGILYHFVFGKSFDDISSANGLLLVTDFLHLNRMGAEMVADMIYGFVTGN